MLTPMRQRPMTLVTGASGVLGSELIQHLQPQSLILGRHRAAMPDKNVADIVRIDITKPNLNLDERTYAHLAETVEHVVHCAAVTDIGVVYDDIETTNVEGARHIIDFAKRANASLFYISTAFCAKREGATHETNAAYVTSKRKAETLVRESNIDWTVIRPSIISGHSATGAISRFQGFHLFFASMLNGRLPFIPLPESALCDFIPVDYAAKAIATLMQDPTYGRTYWLTAGQSALRVKDMIACGQPFAMERGQDLHDLNLADPRTIKDHHLPALKRRLPRGLYERLDTLVELASVMGRHEAFPSDIDALSGTDTPLTASVLRQTLRANIRYWGEAHNRPFQTAAVA